jgi:hypothetical protein|tara:strand:- start:1696 stop:2136 length:441 start_codon:yes stop_codon:yes gene_type:complete
MSEETKAPPKKRKKRRKIWTEQRQETLIVELLNGHHEYFEDLFEAFKKKEKYRGLTEERVYREAKALVRAATPEDGTEDFYVLRMPPRRPVVKAKPLTAAQKRLALIAKHASVMDAAEKAEILEDRAQTKAKRKLKKELEANGAQS